MSRESDSSPYPQDRGRGSGASYPSGTPPYGSPQYPSQQSHDGSQDPAAAEPPAEEPKTETTITTRVRINIPGSRPIPPVVLRTPVNEDQQGGEGGGQAASASADDNAPDPNRPTVLPPGWQFPGAAGQPSSGPGAPASPAVPAPGPGAPSGSGGSGGNGSGGSGGSTTSDWFAPRKSPQGGQPRGGQAGAGQPPSAPDPRVDPETTARTPLPPQQPMGPGPGGGETQPIPFLTDQQLPGGPQPGGYPGPQPQDPRTAPGPGGPEGTLPGGAPMGGGYPGQGPGPGPDPRMDPRAEPSFQPQGPPPIPGGPGPGGPGPGHGGTSQPPADSGPFPSYRPPQAGAPAGPTAGPVTGDMAPPRHGAPPPGGPGAPGRPGDTGGPGAGYRPASGDLSSDTLVSGIPTVPPPGPSVQPSGSGSDGEYRFTGDGEPAPRGRSKLILAGAALLGVVGIAYGAGLLLDHADVPKGTTVLGVDIGGKTKEDAVKSLDAVVGKRAALPVPVQIGNKKEELEPRVAGLNVDTLATVREVAHRDYNPISVIGSLIGSERKADAQFTIDEEKLRAALESLSAKEDSKTQDGMVKFVNGKPVGVPGKGGLALDVNGSVGKISQAYKTRAETGANPTVELDRTQQKPKVTQAEIDRAIKEFGNPAMSGLVVIKAGGIERVRFSPERSLSQFLSMRPTPEGKLEPYFDLPKLESLYGGAFDGLIVDHGGSKGPITPRDVAAVMLPALKETDPAKRVGEIDLAN